MSINIEEQDAKSAVIHTATIVAVCYSRELINGVGKELHDEGQITRLGIPGDHHYGETRYSSTARKTLPNDRPITVCGDEAARAACERLGIPPIPVGGLGENLHLTGAGDLGDLQEGDEIRVLSSSGEPSAIVEVSKQNDPCSNLLIYHKQIVKELYGKRGVICTVLKEGPAHVGDKVEIVRKSSE